MTNQSQEIGLIGGTERRRIEIVDYDARWPETFQRLARTIAGALGDAALRIEHIGSTSVPGLGAKPIIDILLVVEDSRNEAAYLPKMEAIGYELRVREPDWNEHRMFRTPAKDVHVHIYSAACPEIERNLTFRDRLRSDARDRQLYEEKKRELAAQPWPDMDAYAAAKTEIVERIIATARSTTAGQEADANHVLLPSQREVVAREAHVG
ncbi:MAG: GrpB family protein [Verrucomicrobia bacterium]|nr:GrpB family protein [Verrucomicrobiota bacterium]